MHTLVFGVAWTVIAVVFAVALRLEPEWSHQSLLYKVIMTLLPFCGLLVIRDGIRRVRRNRSVKVEYLSSGPVFVWRDFNGAERRDKIDSRPQWDAGDRDFAD